MNRLASLRLYMMRVSIAQSLKPSHTAPPAAPLMRPSSSVVSRLFDMRLMPRLLDSRGRLPPPPPLRAKPARAGCCAPPARERLSSSSASSSSSSIASSAAPSSSSSPSRSPVSLAELSARLLRRPGTLALPFFCACACAWSTLERRADLRPARDASAYSRGSLRILANAPF